MTMRFATTGPLCNLLLGLLIIVQAPIMLGVVSGNAVVAVMPWVMAAYPAIVVAVVFMILNGQLLDATVNGVLSLVLMGQNFVKGVVYLPFATQGALPDANLLASMGMVDGLGFLTGGIVLLFVAWLHFRSSKLAGICIFCCAAGFVCLFLLYYTGLGAFGIVGAVGLLVLAAFLVYAGISELVARVRAMPSAQE